MKVKSLSRVRLLATPWTTAYQAPPYESIERAIWIDEPETWGVTMDLNVRYRKPVPLNEDLLVLTRITKNTRRGFEGIGYILNKEHQVLAEGTARYIKLALNTIDSNSHEEADINILVPDDITEIDIDEIKLFNN